MNAPPHQHGRSLTIVGLGNIGGFLPPLVAKIPGLSRVVFVDRDRYEPGNLASQRIAWRDVGMPKVFAQARVLRSFNSSLTIEVHHADVRDVPPGRLRADVLLSGLDSLEARLWVNQLAWGLGIPWLDAGVAPTEGLVRVSGFRPAPDAPCYECALGDADYRTLGSRAPCAAGSPNAPATNAPAQLGALAAALLVAEAAKVLGGRPADSVLGRQLVFGTESWPRFVSKLVRNPQCRFRHHTWAMVHDHDLTPRTPLAQALAIAASLGGSSAGLRVPGKSFARALRCPKCGSLRAGLHLLGSVAVTSRHCAKCGRERIASAQDVVPQLDASLAGSHRTLRLADLGLSAGDVLEVTGADACLELQPVNDENRCEEGIFSAKNARHLQPTQVAPPESQPAVRKH